MFCEGYFFIVPISFRWLVVPAPKLVLRTYKKLYCSREPYMFKGLRGPLGRHTNFIVEGKRKGRVKETL